MWQYVSGSNDEIDSFTLQKYYNVEYKNGNGTVMTFSNKLVNIGNEHYWFLSKDGMDIIKKDGVLNMTCMSK